MGKLTWVFGWGFGLIGLSMLAVACFTANATLSFEVDALTSTGTVVGFEGGKPVVEFVDDEGETQRVVGDVSSKPPAYERGESVGVLYRLGEADEARIDSFTENWFLTLLFGGLGTVFSGIGGGFAIMQLRKRRLRAWLRQFGVQVQAKYTGTHRDTQVRINGRSPWRITAQWQNPADGVVHTFESDMLFYDPSEFVQREQVEVWIDPKDPGRHLLDIAFLPKHADT